jgi:hypothetical protein
MGTAVFITLETVRCANCGLVFGIDEAHIDRLRATHNSFYCPNGHSLSFNGKTEKEKKIAELERDLRAAVNGRDFWSARSREANEEKQRVERRLRGTRAVVTRMKRRTAKGRCPCCSHEFKDVKRHMKTRHPKWEPEKGADALAQQPRYAQGASE